MNDRLSGGGGWVFDLLKIIVPTSDTEDFQRIRSRIMNPVDLESRIYVFTDISLFGLFMVLRHR